MAPKPKEPHYCGLTADFIVAASTAASSSWEEEGLSSSSSSDSSSHTTHATTHDSGGGEEEAERLIELVSLASSSSLFSSQATKDGCVLQAQKSQNDGDDDDDRGNKDSVVVADKSVLARQDFQAKMAPSLMEFGHVIEIGRGEPLVDDNDDDNNNDKMIRNDKLDPPSAVFHDTDESRFAEEDDSFSSLCGNNETRDEWNEKDCQTETTPTLWINNNQAKAPESLSAAKEQEQKHIIPVPLLENSKDRRGPWKTILFVGGPTTSTRSCCCQSTPTVINAMANFLMGVEYNDSYRYNILRDDTQHKGGIARGGTADDSSSCANNTPDVLTPYHFYPMRPDISYGVTLIDVTAGFVGNNVGIQTKQATWQSIKDFLERQAWEIDAVVVHAECSTHLSMMPRQRYILHKLVDLFGTDIEENIFMIITSNGDGNKKPTAKSALRRARLAGKGRCVHLNSTAVYHGFWHLLESDQCRGVDGIRKIPAENSVEIMEGTHVSTWDADWEALSRFFVHRLCKVPMVSLGFSRDVLTERESLENVILGIHNQVRLGLDTLGCIRKTVHRVLENQDDLNTNADFKIPVSQPSVCKIDLQGNDIYSYTTTCLVCNFSSQSSRSCYPGDWGPKCTNALPDTDTRKHCKVCPRYCEWDGNKTLPYRIEHTVQEVHKILLEKKEASEATINGMCHTEAILRKQREKYVATMMQILQDIEIVRRSIDRLRSIAFCAKVLDPDEHFERMMDSELVRKETGFQARIEALQTAQMQACCLRGIRDAKSQDRLGERDNFLVQIDREIQKIACLNTRTTRANRNGVGMAPLFEFLRSFPTIPWSFSKNP